MPMRRWLLNANANNGDVATDFSLVGQIGYEQWSDRILESSSARARRDPATGAGIEYVNVFTSNSDQNNRHGITKNNKNLN